MTKFYLNISSFFTYLATKTIDFSFPERVFPFFFLNFVINMILKSVTELRVVQFGQKSYSFVWLQTELGSIQSYYRIFWIKRRVLKRELKISPSDVYLLYNKLKT